MELTYHFPSVFDDITWLQQVLWSTGCHRCSHVCLLASMSNWSVALTSITWNHNLTFTVQLNIIIFMHFYSSRSFLVGGGKACHGLIDSIKDDIRDVVGRLSWRTRSRCVPAWKEREKRCCTVSSWDSRFLTAKKHNTTQNHSHVRFAPVCFAPGHFAPRHFST